MSERSSLLRSAGSISVAAAISRLLGLARDQLQAYLFGAGLETDAFLAAFRIPNLLRDLFAEVALSASLVPVFTEVREKEGEAASRALAQRAGTALVVILGLLTVLLAVFAHPLLHFVLPAFGDRKLVLATTMTRILSPFLLFVGLAALAMGVLNTLRVFFVPALSPAWFNLSCVAGMLLLPPVLRPYSVDPILALAAGAIAGGAAQLLVQLPALARRGYRPRWDWAPRDPALTRIATLAIPAVFGLAATQINIFLDTVLASGFGDGPMSWLQYAFRLIQLPIGLFGVAIATANLTQVARSHARGDRGAIGPTLAAATRTAALLTLPATAGLIALGEPIVRILYEHGGRFRPEDSGRTASALLCYALGLHAYALTKIQVPTFYALGETRLPVLASGAAIAVKIAGNFAFVPLAARLGFTPFLGLALSTSVAAWVQCALLAWGMRRRLGLERRSSGLSAALRIGAVAAVMGGACALLYAGLERALPGAGLAAQFVRLAVAVLSGVVLAGAGAFAAGIPEAKALLRRVARRTPSA